MPRYAFRAADAQGIVSRGHIEATQESDVYAALHRRGLSLVDCREKNSQGSAFSRGLPLAEQVLFCRHLLTLVKAGVPVHLALEDVSGLSRNRAMRHALKQIHAAVMKGERLSSVFGEGQFDPLFSILLRAGENTGRLPQALSYLHESLSWKANYGTKLRRMMIYPLIQIGLAAVAVMVLMFVAVPQIINLFGFLGRELPWYSNFLLFAVKALGLGLGAVLISGLAFVTFLPLLRKTSAKVDGFLLRLPLLGPLLSKLALARVAQLFAAMLESGLGMNDALQILPRLTENRALAAELQRVRQHVSDGQGMALAFEQAMHLPAYMIRLLKMGEDGGGLAESLKHVAQLYQQESAEALEAILKGSTVFITALVGFVLAAIVLGVVYPLYQGLGAVMGQG